MFDKAEVVFPPPLLFRAIVQNFVSVISLSCILYNDDNTTSPIYRKRLPTTTWLFATPQATTTSTEIGTSTLQDRWIQI